MKILKNNIAVVALTTIFLGLMIFLISTEMVNSPGIYQIVDTDLELPDGYSVIQKDIFTIKCFCINNPKND